MFVSDLLVSVEGIFGMRAGFHCRSLTSHHLVPFAPSLMQLPRLYCSRLNFNLKPSVASEDSFDLRSLCSTEVVAGLLILQLGSSKSSTAFMVADFRSSFLNN